MFQAEVQADVLAYVQAQVLGDVEAEVQTHVMQFSVWRFFSTLKR
jgi:hypothetical protein